MWYCVKDVTVTYLLVDVVWEVGELLVMSAQPAVVLKAFYFFFLGGNLTSLKGFLFFFCYEAMGDVKIITWKDVSALDCVLPVTKTK